MERKIQEVNLLTEKICREEKFFQKEKEEKKDLMDFVYGEEEYRDY